MATLAQLAAQKQGGIPVSTAMQGESKLAAPTYQVGEKLANDVMGMIGAKNKAVTAINDASVEGAKRVALDKNRELSLYIEDLKVEVAERPNDPEHLANVQSKLSAKYAELSNTGFAFPAAMEAFDVGFTSPASINVARINTSIEVTKLDLMDAQEKKYVHDSALLNASAGNPMNAEQFNTALDVATARGGETERDSESQAFAVDTTSAFDTSVSTNLEGILTKGGYVPENGFDVSTKQNVFTNAFSDAFGYIDDEGELVFYDNFESEKGRHEIRRSWTTFTKTVDRALDSKGKMERSGIPKASDGIKMDGSTSPMQAFTQVKSFKAELKQLRKIGADINHPKQYNSLLEKTNRAEAKATLLEKTAEEYGEFATGGTWEDFINNTTTKAISYPDMKQNVPIGMTVGEATTFAQKQFDNWDDELRATNYDDIMKKTIEGGGKNPYLAIGEVERRSPLKSKYFVESASNLISNGSIAGGANYDNIKSEYKKTSDYLTGKKAIENTWLSRGTRKEISTVFNTIDSQLKQGTIDKKTAGIRVKAYMEGKQNYFLLKPTKVDKVKREALNTTLFSFDADDANEYGWVNFGIGSEVYPQNTQTLIYNDLADDGMSTDDESGMKDFVAERVTPIRSDKSNTGQLPLPFKKAIMLYNQGRDINGGNAAAAISQRISKVMGSKFADISDNTVTSKQLIDDRGEAILQIGIREAIGQPVIHLFTFTLDELEAGELLETKAEKKKGK